MLTSRFLELLLVRPCRLNISWRSDLWKRLRAETSPVSTPRERIWQKKKKISLQSHRTLRPHPVVCCASTEHVGGPNRTWPPNKNTWSRTSGTAAARLTVDRPNCQVQASDVGHGTVANGDPDRPLLKRWPTDRSPTRRPPRRRLPSLPPQLLRVPDLLRHCGGRGLQLTVRCAELARRRDHLLCLCQHSENE